MTDKELLDYAAKAAGIRLKECTCVTGSPINEVTGMHWNPLRDDGAAFRLAMGLGIAVDPGDFDIEARHRDSHASVYETITPDTKIVAAARRAIVRCAAEIGKEL